METRLLYPVTTSLLVYLNKNKTLKLALGKANGIATLDDKGKIKPELIPDSIAGLSGYDNSQSGLEATTVQGAIDELATKGGGLNIKYLMELPNTNLLKHSGNLMINTEDGSVTEMDNIYRTPQDLLEKYPNLSISQSYNIQFPVCDENPDTLLELCYFTDIEGTSEERPVYRGYLIEECDGSFRLDYYFYPWGYETYNEHTLKAKVVTAENLSKVETLYAFILDYTPPTLEDKTIYCIPKQTECNIYISGLSESNSVGSAKVFVVKDISLFTQLTEEEYDQGYASLYGARSMKEIYGRQIWIPKVIMIYLNDQGGCELYYYNHDLIIPLEYFLVTGIQDFDLHIPFYIKYSLKDNLYDKYYYHNYTFEKISESAAEDDIDAELVDFLPPTLSKSISTWYLWNNSNQTWNTLPMGLNFEDLDNRVIPNTLESFTYYFDLTEEQQNTATDSFISSFGKKAYISWFQWYANDSPNAKPQYGYDVLYQVVDDESQIPLDAGDNIEFIKKVTTITEAAVTGKYYKIHSKIPTFLRYKGINFPVTVSYVSNNNIDSSEGVTLDELLTPMNIVTVDDCNYYNSHTGLTQVLITDETRNLISTSSWHSVVDFYFKIYTTSGHYGTEEIRISFAVKQGDLYKYLMDSIGFGDELLPLLISGSYDMYSGNNPVENLYDVYRFNGYSYDLVKSDVSYGYLDILLHNIKPEIHTDFVGERYLWSDISNFDLSGYNMDQGIYSFTMITNDRETYYVSGSKVYKHILSYFTGYILIGTKASISNSVLTYTPIDENGNEESYTETVEIDCSYSSSGHTLYILNEIPSLSELEELISQNTSLIETLTSLIETLASSTQTNRIQTLVSINNLKLLSLELEQDFLLEFDDSYFNKYTRYDDDDNPYQVIEEDDRASRKILPLKVPSGNSLSNTIIRLGDDIYTPDEVLEINYSRPSFYLDEGVSYDDETGDETLTGERAETAWYYVGGDGSVSLNPSKLILMWRKDNPSKAMLISPSNIYISEYKPSEVTFPFTGTVHLKDNMGSKLIKYLSKLV